MAQNQAEELNLKSAKRLWDICVDFFKKNIPISVDLLLDLPHNIVEELALSLRWTQLLRLENNLNNTDVTERAWKHKYEQLPKYNHRKKPGTCLHHHNEGFDVPLSYRDLWLKAYVEEKLHGDYLRQKRGCRPEWLHNPRLTMHGLECRIQKMAEEVKKISLQSHMLGMFSPELLDALTTRLVHLKIVGPRNHSEGALEWLQPFEKMMRKGRLRSLQILNADPFASDWLQTLFVISGLFHCSVCAHYFSAALGLAKAWQSADHSEGDWDEASSQSIHKSVTPWKTCVSSSGEAGGNEDVSVSRASKLVEDCSKWFPAGPPSDFLRALKQLRYAGLVGEEDMNFSAACGSRDSGGVTLERKSGGVEDLPKAAEGCGSSDSASDLMDEALGLSATEKAPWASSAWKCSWQGTRLVDSLSRFHMEEGHTSRGLEHLYLSSCQCAKVRLTPNVLVQDAVAYCLPGWSSLASIHLDLGQSLSDFAFEKLMSALLCRINAGTLQSVSLCFVYYQPALPSCYIFLWETLHILSGMKHTESKMKRTHPMQCLKIESQERAMFCIWPGIAVMEQGDTTTMSDFPGLQELCLKLVHFLGVDDFRCLGEFVRRDHALCRLSLVDCFLNEASFDLLLDALNGGVHKSLQCVNLQGSVSIVTDKLWEKVCTLLHTYPSLTCLNLACCKLSEERVKWNQFASAVRDHGRKRHLTLDLSSNFLGAGVWDFVAKAVCPESSLKKLHIRQTGSTCQKGVATLGRIIQDYPDHLPLLESCSWSYTPDHDHSEQLKAHLEKICWDGLCSVTLESEYVAMM